MSKFITVTNKSNSKQVDVNMDHIESFCLADDPQGGTKVFAYSLTKDNVESPDYWRVHETPEQIRAMLNGQRVGTAIQAPWPKAGVVTPMRYTFDGIEVSEQEIVEALQMARNVLFKG